MAHDELIEAMAQAKGNGGMTDEIAPWRCKHECERNALKDTIEQQAAEVKRLNDIEDALGLAAIQMRDRIEQQAARIAKLFRWCCKSWAGLTIWTQCF